MKTDIFNGCAAAVITPFKNNGKDVDFDAYLRLLVHLHNGKTDAFVVNGTTGEAATLNSEEKQLLLKYTVQNANKKPVIAGTGSNNTDSCVKNCNAAEKEGVNGLLIVTPFYNKCSQEGLIKHYFYIADRVSTPIIVYNVPARTGVNIKPETYLALGEHKNIVAVKEASGDMSLFYKSIALCKDKLDFYSGNDDLTVPCMSLGGKGVISVAANVIPDIMHKITELCLHNNFSEAAKEQNNISSLLELLFCDVNPQPVKYACSRVLSTEGILRLPLCEISSKNKALIDKELYRLNILKKTDNK